MNWELILLAGAFIASCVTLFVTWQTARRQLRAYVNVSELSVTEITHPVTVKFKNVGQTPANKCNAQVRLWAFPKGTENFTLPTLAMESQLTLGSGMEQGIGAQWPQLDDAQMTAVQRGEITVWLFGRIRYDDIYGHHHTTNFRFQLATPDGNWKTGGFKATVEGNDAT
jgi:hypothetical protein